MALNWIKIKRKKKNKKNMNSEYSFTNYLNRRFQIKQQYGKFQRGEVVKFVDYITVEDENIGYLVTADRRRLKESDASKLLINYNPANPTIPVYKTQQKTKTTPDPYKQKIMLDENTPLGDTSTNIPTNKSNIQSTQKIIKNNNIFSVFENDTIKLNLPIIVNLPKWTFVRDMYKNASDKEDFIKHLTEHIHKQITPDIILETIKSKLNPVPRKKLKENENTKQKRTEKSIEKKEN